MNPWFISGFSDGEACFEINIYKSDTHILGWGARAAFKIGLHKKDLPILESIQNYFGVGNILVKDNVCVFYIQSIKNLDILLKHFDRYPLITQKQGDYLLFKMAINLIKEKAHMNLEGLRKLVALRASLNRGIPSTLAAVFPNTIPYPRPSVTDITIKDPQWLAGFTSAEGCFLVLTSKVTTNHTGHQVFLMFKLVQHSRDEQLMISLVDYLGCGRVQRYASSVEYRVTKFSDIKNKIFPFFQKYFIQGVKHQDYSDFVSVMELMNTKNHLRVDGLKQILTIKAGMNKGRSL